MYSPPAEEKLGEPQYPARNHAQGTIRKRISRIFRKEPVEQRFQESTRIGVNYDKELANGLRKLFKATDLVNSVRIVASDGYVSEYDLVYPSVYGRVLVRTFKALRDVNISAKATLEILDCPVTHLEESGLSIDQQLVSDVLRKFTTFGFSYRTMSYAVIKRGILPVAHQRRHYNPDQNMDPKGLGMQLLNALQVNFSHLEGLMLKGVDHGPQLADLLLSSKSEKPNFRRLKLLQIKVSHKVLSEYINPCLPQMQAIELGCTISGDYSRLGPGKTALLDEWIALRQNRGSKQWHLEILTLNNTETRYPPHLSEDILQRIQRLTIT